MSPQHQVQLVATSPAEERGDPRDVGGCFGLDLGHQWGCGRLGIIRGCHAGVGQG